MGAKTMMAAKTIADSLDYNVTNLAMQKLLYLSHMYTLFTSKPENHLG